MGKVSKYIKISPERDIIGCIGLVRGTTWLARQIRLFMNIYRRKVDKPKLEVYNHSFNIIVDNGYLKVSEALAKGITVQHFLEAYPEDRWKDIMLLVPKDPLTVKEKILFSKISLSYNNHPTRYQYLNFLSQMIWILFGIWIGEDNKGNDKRFYCTEYSASVYYELREYFYYKQRINPVDLQIDENFDHLGLTWKTFNYLT